MRKFTVSVVLSFPEQLLPEIPNLEVQGANLSIARWLGLILADEATEALEVFLPPAEYLRQEVLAEVAGHVLPPHRRGQGILRFYPLHSLPEIWADGTSRLFLSTDIELFPRDRYLRDKYSIGPMAIYTQVHGLGSARTYDALRKIAEAVPVPFDMIGSLSRSCDGHMRRFFEPFAPDSAPTFPCQYVIVPNTADDKRFRPVSHSERRAIRAEFEIPEDRTIALYYGRMTPHSKADLMPLIRQFARVSGPNDLLLLAGVENTTGYVARLLSFAEELGIRDRVIYREGKDPSKRHNYFAMADLFVFPCDNVQECLGNTILEAMMSGLPVLTTDWDGMRDMVVADETGYLVPTYWMPGLERVQALSPAAPFMTNMLYLSQNCVVDSPALGDALAELLRNPELRQRLGIAGRARAEGHFSWPAVRKNLFAAWESALDLAEAESDADRRSRSLQAESLAPPLEAARLFGHYATFRPSATELMVRLSDIGARFADRIEPLTFYDETIPLLRPDVIQALFREVVRAGSAGLRISELSTLVAEECKVLGDDVLYSIALLAKRDAFLLQISA